MTYTFPETFGELSEKQVREIASLLHQLSPQRPFTSHQLRISMMFGSLCIASDKENDQKVIGMGLLLYHHTSLYSSASIENVVVDSSYQGKKIGRSIMEHLIERARRFPRPLVHIDLTSKPERIKAHSLYSSLGFEKRATNAYRFTLKN